MFVLAVFVRLVRHGLRPFGNKNKLIKSESMQQQDSGDSKFGGVVGMPSV
jgi:hypothetical protein